MGFDSIKQHFDDCNGMTGVFNKVQKGYFLMRPPRYRVCKIKDFRVRAVWLLYHGQGNAIDEH